MAKSNWYRKDNVKETDQEDEPFIEERTSNKKSQRKGKGKEKTGKHSSRMDGVKTQSCLSPGQAKES